MTSASTAPTRDPLRFKLIRHTDATGVSGEGVVAEGCMWSDGYAVTHWLGTRSSTAVWHRSGIGDPHWVHSHAAATRFVWLDPGAQCDARNGEQVCNLPVGHDENGSDHADGLRGDSATWPS